MKFLKKLFFLLIAIVALLLIAALFVRKEFTVTRTISIQRNSEEVFDYLRYLDHQSEFGVWHKKDPNIVITSQGTDGEVGYISKWHSKKEEVGVGEQEIIKIIEGKQIDFALRFKEPFESNADARFKVEEKGADRTAVNWTFHGKSPYPFNLMLLFMDVEKSIGPDLESGLENLKHILEERD